MTLYLEGAIVSIRSCLHNNTSTPNKSKKDLTNIATTIEEIQPTIWLMYVPTNTEVAKKMYKVPS